MTDIEWQIDTEQQMGTWYAGSWRPIQLYVTKKENDK